MAKKSAQKKLEPEDPGKALEDALRLDIEKDDGLELADESSLDDLEAQIAAAADELAKGDARPAAEPNDLVDRLSELTEDIIREGLEGDAPQLDPVREALRLETERLIRQGFEDETLRPEIERKLNIITDAFAALSQASAGIRPVQYKMVENLGFIPQGEFWTVFRDVISLRSLFRAFRDLRETDASKFCNMHLITAINSIGTVARAMEDDGKQSG